MTDRKRNSALLRAGWNPRVAWLLAIIFAATVAVFGFGAADQAEALGPNAMRPGFDASTLARNDDGSTGFVGFGFGGPIDYFGTNYTGGYVNNNGNVTLDSALSTFTPFSLTSTGRVIIAPFFGDVDTRSGGDPVRYGTGTVSAFPAWGATYANVQCYNASSATPLGYNYFQVILIDRSDTGAGNFDMEFNYDQILWETGQASGGNSQCLGGSPARVGWSNGTGDPGTSFELAGSGVTSAFLDGNLATGLIHNSLNSAQIGRYLFQVRGGVPVQADLALSKTATPDPVANGGTLTYTLNVSNAGPDAADNVVISDTLPAGATFGSGAGCAEAAGVVTCALGTVASGGSTSASFTVAFW